MADNRIRWDNLSALAKEDYSNYRDSHKDAISLIMDSIYERAIQVHPIEIMRRFESQYLCTMSYSDLKNRNSWENFSCVDPHEVAEDASTLTDDGLTSSFTLKEINHSHTLKYPLDDNYISPSSPFNKPTFKNYKHILESVGKIYGLKVIEKDRNISHEFKKSKLKAVTKNLVYGIANLCRSAFKKDACEFRTTSSNGTLKLSNNISINNGSYRRVTQAEKMAVVYDRVLREIVKKQNKNNNNRNCTSKFDKSCIIHAATLLSNILVTRATDYDDKSQALIVEKCLSLQFSNICAKDDFSPIVIKYIGLLANLSAYELLRNLGLSNQDILDNLQKNGFINTNTSVINSSNIFTNLIKADIDDIREVTYTAEPLSEEEAAKYSFSNQNFNAKHDDSEFEGSSFMEDNIIYVYPTEKARLQDSHNFNAPAIFNEKSNLEAEIFNSIQFETKEGNYPVQIVPEFENANKNSNIKFVTKKRLLDENMMKKYAVSTQRVKHAVDKIITKNLQELIVKLTVTEDISKSKLENKLATGAKLNKREQITYDKLMNKSIINNCLNGTLGYLNSKGKSGNNSSDFSITLGKHIIEMRIKVLNNIFKGEKSIDVIESMDVNELINSTWGSNFSDSVKNIIIKLINTNLLVNNTDNDLQK